VPSLIKTCWFQIWGLFLVRIFTSKYLFKFLKFKIPKRGIEFTKFKKFHIWNERPLIIRLGTKFHAKWSTLKFWLIGSICSTQPIQNDSGEIINIDVCLCVPVKNLPLLLNSDQNANKSLPDNFPEQFEKKLCFHHAIFWNSNTLRISLSLKEKEAFNNLEKNDPRKIYLGFMNIFEVDLSHISNGKINRQVV